MWKHRNKTLFNNQIAEVLYKRRKAIIRAVKTQIKIGFQYIRLKDRQTICKKYATLKKWTTPMLEAWLKHVNTIRKKAPCTLQKELDLKPFEHDNIFIERRENLKRFSIPKFARWRLKHHALTTGEYVQSTEELRRQLKRRRLN